MKVVEIYRNNRNIILLAVLIIILVVIVSGCVLIPSLFYDQWIWKYYWGPVVADATPNVTTAIHKGIIAKEGYTIISEITYGIILVIALYAIYKLLKKLRISIDWKSKQITMHLHAFINKEKDASKCEMVFWDAYDIQVPHTSPWGESSSINEVHRSGDTFEIEMQSGDKIKIKSSDYSFNSLK